MSSNKYWVPMVAKAIGLIEAISATDRELTLHEISRGEDISKTSAFRILFTLASVILSTTPLGQRISIRSIFVRFSRPKCSLGSFCEM